MKNVKINNSRNFYTLSFKNIAVINAQIYNYGILNIENCKFTSNSADSFLFSHKFSNLDLNSQININNTVFFNISSNGNFIITNCSDVSIFNSYFYNNFVGYNGFISSINSSLTINNSCFFNNNAVKEGGVIYVCESLVDIDNSLFVNSSASFGGAICNLKSKTDIKNSKFLNNTAVYDGGAIYNMYSTLNLTETVFNNNGPSGLFFDNSSSNICFSNFTQTDIEVSYGNDFNIDNISIHGDVIYSNISLDRISGVPIYYGNSNLSNLSSRYDGRDYNLNTSVKNQGSGGNCWAFASLATLESCILKANNQSVFDLSEENMKNVIAKFSDYGFNKTTNDGGNYKMVSGYLSSWLGPVLDDADVYCPKSTLSPILDSCMHVQNIYFIPFDNDLVKEAVFKYGAVYYGFLSDENYLDLIGNHYTYNYNGCNTEVGGHAVSIIGWDDNYSRENFKYKPANDGAWIVKNSWGSTTQDDGYMYISYENNIYTPRYVSFFTLILNDTNEYNHNYQYDIAWTDRKNSTCGIYYSNNFTSNQNEVLTAVSTYFLTAPVNYNISIKINDILSHNQSGKMEKWGYYTIPLTKQLQLNKNDRFEVIFHLDASYVEAPFCNDNDITHILYPNNSSRYSYDNTNWVTLDHGVFCIKAFTVLNKTNISIIQLNDTVYTRNNQNQIFFQILDNGGSNVERGKLILNIDNNNYTANVVNGIAEFDNVLLSHTGFFNCNVVYIDDVLYENSNITCSIINKEFLDANFTLITPYYGQVQKIKIEIPENRQIVIQFNDSTISINETSIIELGMLNKGDYSILIVGYDEDNFYIDDNVFNFTVLNETYILIAEDLTKYYNGTERFYVTLTHTLNQSVSDKSITIELNGMNYTVTTNLNGTASIAINLLSGHYTAIVRFNELSITSQVTVKPTIYAEDVVKMFLNGTQYYATFVDTNGALLVNTTMTFNINGIIYNRKTNGSGVAKLNINLPQGEYIITAKNSVTNENISNNVTVLSKIESSDLTKYYKNESQFIVRLLDDNGLYVGAGETVRFNVNGVFYTRGTNETGYAKLNINLPFGNYTVTTYYMNCTESNMVTILPILTAEDLTKQYGDHSQFVVKLLNGQGHPYPNQNITFNINGATYKRTTDNNGNAKLNINLPAGEYIITSSYNDAYISNRIIILP